MENVQDALVESALDVMSENQLDQDLASRWQTLQKDMASYDYTDQAQKEIMQMRKQQLHTETANYVADKVVNGLGGLNNAQIRELKQVAQTATQTAYVEGQVHDGLTRVVGDTNINDFAKGLIEETGVSNVRHLEPQFRRTQAFGGNISDEISAYAFDDNSGQGAKKMLQSLGEGVSKALRKPNGMALATLATVGSILAVGAVGGNPSEATGLEAAKMAQVSIQDLDQMSIQNQGQVSSNNKGYVINIKGRGSHAAVSRTSEKISRTMGNSFSSNVNINMNISQGDRMLSDRDIEQFITDAIY